MEVKMYDGDSDIDEWVDEMKDSLEFVKPE